MLSEDKITVDETERLLEALGGHGPTYQQASAPIREIEIPEFRDEGQTHREDPIGP